MLSIREHRFPFLAKVSNWNRFSDNTGGTLVEKCCHHFDLMRLILRSEPHTIFASGGQDLNHTSEEYGGKRSDILDNAFVLVTFANGARAVLDLCMFAEASKHQEEICLVGTHAKLEAFAPSHGTKQDDRNTANYRRSTRNPAFASGEWTRDEPPPPFECGETLEEHVEVPAELLEAGSHAGSTFFEVTRFAQAVRSGGQPAVTLSDGSK